MWNSPSVFIYTKQQPPCKHFDARIEQYSVHDGLNYLALPQFFYMSRDETVEMTQAGKFPKL